MLLAVVVRPQTRGTLVRDVHLDGRERERARPRASRFPVQLSASTTNAHWLDRLSAGRVKR